MYYFYGDELQSDSYCVFLNLNVSCVRTKFTFLYVKVCVYACGCTFLVFLFLLIFNSQIANIGLSIIHLSHDSHVDK